MLLPSSSLRISCLLLLCSLAAARAQQKSAPAPLTPEQIDRQWIAASSGVSSEQQHARQQARQHQLSVLARTTEAGPFRSDWQSLQQHRTPSWFSDAKFGIFIHWGVFSVPAFGNEWYARNMYQPGTPEFAHHRAVYGSQAQFGYKDFIPKFRMEHFDPDAWAELFFRAGARYVVPVAEHHDGFALYSTRLSRWNAVDMGPHRDLVGDLQRAVRAKGLKFGVSFHRAEHDWFFDGGRRFNSDVNDPRLADLYGPAERREQEGSEDHLDRDYTYVSGAFLDDWLARCTELELRYQPDLMYFDWWVGSPDFRRTEERFAAFFYDDAAQHGRNVVLNTKNNNMADGAGTLDVERGALSGIQAVPWQTDTSLSNASWGYVAGDTYKPAQSIIDELVDVVSKNGNLLLNIGPRADGTIPDAVQKELLEIGGWLTVNGEGIYGSRPWKRFGEGPTGISAGSFQDATSPAYTPADFRFTIRAGYLYAFVMHWPSGGEAVVHSLTPADGKIREVSLLGYDNNLQWKQKSDGLHITLPAWHPASFVVAFKISLQEPAVPSAAGK